MKDIRMHGQLLIGFKKPQARHYFRLISNPARRKGETEEQRLKRLLEKALHKPIPRRQRLRQFELYRRAVPKRAIETEWHEGFARSDARAYFKVDGTDSWVDVGKPIASQ